MTTRRRLEGLYLVADLSRPLNELLKTLDAALRGGVDVIQLWGASSREEAVYAGRRMLKLSGGYDVPVLVNGDIELAKELRAAGIHFDIPDMTPEDARRILGQETLVGFTCGSDLSRVRWAEENGADYVSFCAVFPSPSVTECEIVPLTTVREAKKLVKIPVFASGGITEQNVQQVLEAGADGVAVISAILSAPDPEESARRFKAIIQRYKATSPDIGELAH